MSKTTYTVTSEEGQRYGAPVGETVELELDPVEERAVIAAGWIEPEQKPAKQAKEAKS